jgi:hypothetical protein
MTSAKKRHGRSDQTLDTRTDHRAQTSEPRLTSRLAKGVLSKFGNESSESLCNDGSSQSPAKSVEL